jgi:rubrerythrin
MDNDTLFDVFKKAIVHEFEAHEFYKKAAANTQNAEAKALFEQFAMTELNHKRALEDLYASLKR